MLVWIHGGGLVLGSKTGSGDPAGLIASSLANEDSEGVIFVAINYRVSNFIEKQLISCLIWLTCSTAWSFLGGPGFNYSSGTPNAGLLDQRHALGWIQNHIHRFGGDANRVTVIGESGGASSIAHHMIAAQNTGEKAPFQQAILQSAVGQSL